MKASSQHSGGMGNVAEDDERCALASNDESHGSITHVLRQSVMWLPVMNRLDNLWNEAHQLTLQRCQAQVIHWPSPGRCVGDSSRNDDPSKQVL